MAPVGRVEEDHPALVFVGRWHENLNAANSGSRAVLAMDAGSRATINFSGTGVSWMGNRDEWSGIARFYVDGQLKTTIDNCLSPLRCEGSLMPSRACRLVPTR